MREYRQRREPDTNRPKRRFGQNGSLLRVLTKVNKYVFAAVRFWERLLFCTHCRFFWECLFALLCCTYFRFFVRTASEHLGVLAHQFSVLKAICHKLQKALFPARIWCFLAFFGQFWVFLRAFRNPLNI